MKSILIPFILLTISLPISQSAFADDNLINDPELIYITSTDNYLAQNITINRTFENITALLNKLNSIDGIEAQVKSQTADSIKPVTVNIDNGTIKNLLNKTSTKLGYKWSFINNVIVFNAINPKQVALESQVVKTVDKKQTTVISSLDKASYNSNSIPPAWQLNIKDKTVRGSLSKWCKKAGWQLVWNVKADYPIDTAWSISGSFESAVNEVLKATQHSEMPLMAVMHDSNHVLEVYSPITSK